jgi:hypothetical protein
MSSRLEQAAGAALMLIGVGDLFLTVLYARIGSRVGSRLGMGIARLLARAASRFCGRLQAFVLSAAAPVILVSLIGLWSLLLSLGAAMVLHPELGEGVRRSAGTTPTDFVSALYVAGGSLSVVATPAFMPETAAMRAVFVVNAFVGASVLTLTITYLMQIYRALQTRNALGLKVHTMSGASGNGARLLAAWGPEGRFDICYSSVAEVAGELAQVHEAHHLYPLVFYFRFDTEYPNLALYLPVILEATTLLHCALHDHESGWLKRSAAAQQLWHASTGLLGLLENVFVPKRFEANARPMGADARRARFTASLALLREHGIATAGDERLAADQDAKSLDQWLDRSLRLAAYLDHPADTVLR